MHACAQAWVARYPYIMEDANFIDTVIDAIAANKLFTPGPASQLCAFLGQPL